MRVVALLAVGRQAAMRVHAEWTVTRHGVVESVGIQLYLPEDRYYYRGKREGRISLRLLLAPRTC